MNHQGAEVPPTKTHSRIPGYVLAATEPCGTFNLCMLRMDRPYCPRDGQTDRCNDPVNMLAPRRLKPGHHPLTGLCMQALCKRCSQIAPRFAVRMNALCRSSGLRGSSTLCACATEAGRGLHVCSDAIPHRGSLKLLAGSSRTYTSISHAQVGKYKYKTNSPCPSVARTAQFFAQ